MIKFVNAKINLGLQIVRKREDGYHDLQTVFYPVGKYAGTAENPCGFCDILELSENPRRRKQNYDSGKIKMPEIIFTGREIDCEPEKNLVYKAAQAFCEATGCDFDSYTLQLEKHLPDGAGMGGGSADAGFTLRVLSELYSLKFPDEKIEDKMLFDIARRLGADCPFFLLNKPAYAEGIGELLEEIDLDLQGLWLVVVKPAVYISTKAAFAGVTPHKPEFNLREITSLPLSEWKYYIKNDFETSILPQFPVIGEIKNQLYSIGALYSSMSGSGSSVFGIFSDKDKAEEAMSEIKKETTIEGCYLLKM